MIFCEKVYHYGPGAKNKYDDIDRLIPVWIVHVLLGNFVRLRVDINGMFSLRSHVILPDDATLLSYLKFTFSAQLIEINSIISYFVKRISIKPRMQGVSLNATQILQREDFQLHIPSPGKIRSDLGQLDPSAVPNLKDQQNQTLSNKQVVWWAARPSLVCWRLLL